jgi:hypothetical protein
MDYKLILYDVDEQGIARITFNDHEAHTSLEESRLQRTIGCLLHGNPLDT